MEVGGEESVKTQRLRYIKTPKQGKNFVDWGRNTSSQKVADPTSGPFQTWPYITFHLAVYLYPF